MSLSKLQREFTLCVSQLINYAYARGWELTFGDAYRDPRVHGVWGQKITYSAAKSQHKNRLAVDFNLFVDGEYISDGDHPAYRALGKEWKAMHNKAAWGGDFNDANHFSFEYQGYK